MAYDDAIGRILNHQAMCIAGTAIHITGIPRNRIDGSGSL